MKNPIKTALAQHKENEKKLEEEQARRLERLRELEDGSSRKGLNKLNVVKGISDAKEKKAIKKEIAEYEAKKTNKKTIKTAGVVVVAGMCVLGGIALADNNKSQPVDSNGNSIVSENVVEETISDKEAEEAAKAEAEAKAKQEAEEKARKEAEEKAKKEAEERARREAEEKAKAEAEAKVKEETAASKYTKITSKDISVYKITEYLHINGSQTVIALGNYEEATITVQSSVAEMKANDIKLIYDDELLSVKTGELRQIDGKALLSYYVTGKAACSTGLAIVTSYDFEIDGDNAKRFEYTIIKRDSKDGRVVYITETGEKYHYSQTCPKGNGIKTTFYDAVSWGYDPCSKCVH